MKKFHRLMQVLGLVFLIFLVWKLGIRELSHELMALGWGIVPIVAAEGVAELFHVIAWRYCLLEPHASIPVLRLFRISMAGYAIAYLTPTASVGGDVTKAGLLTMKGNAPGAAAGVIVGKLSFALAHLSFVFFGSILLWRQVHLPQRLWIALSLASALLACGTVIFLLIQKHGKLGALIRRLRNRYPKNNVFQRVSTHTDQLDKNLQLFYREKPRGLPIAVLWHLAGYSAGSLPLWYFLHVSTGGALFSTAACTYILATWLDLVVFALPMTLGVLEGTRILAFKTLGYAPQLGLTYGVAFRLAQLFWAGFGLINYRLLTRQKIVHAKSNSPARKQHKRNPEPSSCDGFGRSA